MGLVGMPPRKTVLIALVSSAALQLPFLVLLMTGPHYGGSVAEWFFLPTLHIVDHMPPPFDFELDTPRHSELGTLVELVAIQFLLSTTLIFSIVTLAKWLATSLRRSRSVKRADTR